MQQDVRYTREGVPVADGAHRLEVQETPDLALFFLIQMVGD
jgi:hypothetical protein